MGYHSIKGKRVEKGVSHQAHQVDPPPLCSHYASRGVIGAAPWIITSLGGARSTLKDWALGLSSYARHAKRLKRLKPLWRRGGKPRCRKRALTRAARLEKPPEGSADCPRRAALAHLSFAHPRSATPPCVAQLLSRASTPTCAEEQAQSPSPA